MRSTLQSEIRLLQSAVRLARNPGPTESIRTISRNSAIAKGLRSDDSASSRPRRSYKEGRNGGDSDVRKDTGGYKGRKPIQGKSHAPDARRVERPDKSSRFQSLSTTERFRNRYNPDGESDSSLWNDDTTSYPHRRPRRLLAPRKGSELEHLKEYFPKPRPERDYEEGPQTRSTDRPRRDVREAQLSAYMSQPVPYTTAASQHIYGLRAVKAVLSSQRRKVYKLYVIAPDASAPKHAEREEIVRWAERMDIPVEIVDATFIARIANVKSQGGSGNGTHIHDCILIDAAPYPQQPINALSFSSRFGNFFNLELATQTKEEAEVNGTLDRVDYSSGGWRQPFLLWLHGVNNVGNFGAILRSALFFGVDGIILSNRETVTVSPATVRASAGAADFLPILTVTSDSKDFINASKANGWQFYAAVASSHGGVAPVTLSGMSTSPLVKHPCVLMLGNEEYGLPKWLVGAADQRITITGQSALAKDAELDSLNVSVAAALLTERFLAKPDGKKKGASAAPEKVEEKEMKEEQLF